MKQNFLVFLFVSAIQSESGFSFQHQQQRRVSTNLLIHRSLTTTTTNTIGPHHLRSTINKQRKISRRLTPSTTLKLTSASSNPSTPSSPFFKTSSLKSVSNIVTKYSPIWTFLASICGLTYPKIISSACGNIQTMQYCLGILMLSMGLTIQPKDLENVLTKNSFLLFQNLMLCFGMMPLLALGIASILGYNTYDTAGIILLGCVSGGQASNLFTMISGGDVALSIICTLTSTLVGVLATPVLIQFLLGTSLNIDSIGVLKSVVKLVLAPLVIGLTLNRKTNSSSSSTTTTSSSTTVVERIKRYICPLIGVFSTLILVAGGAANSASNILLFSRNSSETNVNTMLNFMMSPTVTGSYLLPLLGGFVSYLWLSVTSKSKSRSKRALVIETLSKSPTLAYVLAQKHFDSQTCAIPAMGMVSLAVIGSLVASLWSTLSPVENIKE